VVNGVVTGLLHPGEMGAAVGQCLTGAGHEVLWASAGRGPTTAARAAGFGDAGTAAAVASRAEVIVSVCPPSGARFVDGGIIGGPPAAPGDARLYLAGARADSVADLFRGTALDARVIPGEIGAASALKMSYAAWTKGTAALLLAIRELARAEGVEDALLTEWALSQPSLETRSSRAVASAAAKGWRWIAEMEEIAASMTTQGLPAGFHQAAADIYRRNA
jgi:3-hydroxyisobutyrate dehydrogenase-like beta-hydroxyacid dehydrogenase